ncbi:hypothetical protein [Absidia glauca]|uniref:BLOC-1-related complex subunit 7 n=1 Tax=Absidia glauca TaxID=4829 RepID=A0A168LFE6_ABSGL|nr:hypothetical protein [Absidia glauca]
MSKLPTSTITPSYSFRSLKSIKSITGEDTWMAKDECHYQAENTMDDWTACLKGLQAASHEETMKTVKQFVQADTHAKHTYQNLDKTRRTLDMLFDQKLTLLSTVSTLTEIETNLGLERLAKSYWIEPPSRFGMRSKGSTGNSTLQLIAVAGMCVNILGLKPLKKPWYPYRPYISCAASRNPLQFRIRMSVDDPLVCNKVLTTSNGVYSRDKQERAMIPATAPATTWDFGSYWPPGFNRDRHRSYVENWMDWNGMDIDNVVGNDI